MARGRGASPDIVRTGLFIKEHLLAIGEDFPANIHREFKKRLKDEGRRRTPTYHSFLRYLHQLVSFGLLEFSGREEPMKTPPNLLHIRDSVSPTVVSPMHRYYRLTALGRTNHPAWYDPAGFRVEQGSYTV